MLGDVNVRPTIAVKDMAAAKEFYGSVLGLELASEDEGGALYKSGTGSLYIYPSDYAGTNQATYAEWTVEDIESAIESLKSKGVQFEHYDNLGPMKREGDIHVMGAFKMAWFKDPSGNILAIDNGGM